MEKRQVVQFFGLLFTFTALLMILQTMRFGSLTGFVVLNYSEGNELYFGKDFYNTTITSMASSEISDSPSIIVAVGILVCLAILYLVIRYFLYHNKNVMKLPGKSVNGKKLIKLDLR